jgi:glyoxylase-like metal-dependent hydrolase (beta-lactamase superfamily II)/8-oxo-dGTP pyrophosphatase MutT (NUDIX family)
MKESVSVIFKYKNEIFAIKRQNHLRAFPGYHAFPGGKVDTEDYDFSLKDNHSWKKIPNNLLGALIREVQEELSIDLHDLNTEGKVKDLQLWSKAVTPEFNPYRFCNYYFVVEMNIKPEFKVDVGEIKETYWLSAKEYIEAYKSGDVLCVPVFIDILEYLLENQNHNEYIDMTPKHPKDYTPLLRPLSGIKQFLPLSNTFPPANRTNSYLIGDKESGRFLIDPSPKDEQELSIFIKTLAKEQIDALLITHHHRDHYEHSNTIAKKLDLPIYLSEGTLERILKKDDANYFSEIEIHLLKEGDVLTKWKNEEVKVYEVPGHDEGQIALAPKSMKWFLVGDLIQTIGTVVVGGEEGDMQKYFDSLNKVIELNPNVLLPSHGIAIGGTNKLTETLKHRQMRENHIKELMSEKKTEDEMMQAIYPDLVERLHKYARKIIRAHIKKIEDEI